ncbi:Stress regulated protein [Zea mays]|uniref:Stress regulated protein n=1 Tax=Zea mays TaxID=4577 RepID=A0A1D6MTD8_MAIZE|nr:Stress regulated protein [Zea mays]
MSTNLGGASCFGFGLTQMQPAAVRLRLPPARAADTSSSQSPARLTAVLEQVDQLLSQGNDMAALSLVRSTQGGDGGLRAFGAARQVPQRLYKLDELKLNGIDTSAFLSPVDLTLGSIERNLQIAAVLGGFSVSAALELSQLQILFLILGLLSLWSVDFVSKLPLPSKTFFHMLQENIYVYFGGGVRNLVLDTIGHYLSQKYHNRVIQHEAGHFLIAYLLGVLPKGYTITSLDTLMNQGSLNVQAGAAFVDYEFLEEVSSINF